jgi:site-specific recombinase XerD
MFRRGSVWWVSFRVNDKQVRLSTGTENKALAKKIEAKIRTEIAEGRYFEKIPDRTFKELMEKVLNDPVANLKSKYSYENRVNQIISHFGEMNLSEITPSVIQEYKAKRKAEGLKPATLNREIATMKKAFSLAVEWEWLKHNPIAKVSLEKENNARTRWLTYGEESELLPVCPEWLKEIVVFALNTGMRSGEILSLEWRGVDFNRKTITIFQSKNNEPRTIPMTEIVFEMLQGKSKVKSIRTNLVFYNTRTHEGFSTPSVGHAFQKAVKKSGIEDIRFHDLRHTVGSRLVQAGVNLYSVKLLFGHKDWKMTERYSHHSIESLKKALLFEHN